MYRFEKIEYKNHKGCIQSPTHWGIFRLSQWDTDFHFTWFTEWILADWIVRGEYSSYCLYCWTIGILWVCMHANWSHKCTCYFSTTNGILSQRYAFGLVQYLLDNIIIFSQTPQEHILRLRGIFWETMGSWIEVETFKVWILLISDLIFRSYYVQRRHRNRS